MALSVHFKHPDLGMKDYEILSRGSAFLLNVDPPEPPEPEGKYAHLVVSREERAAKLKKQDYRHDPAGGPPRRVQDLGWLEFAPGAYRPLVHCMAASHVLAPWNWKQYYPMDWLQIVRQEHCVYSLQVYDPDTAESLGKFALNPYVIHHPEEMDLAVIHLKQEEATLKHLRDLGVDIMYLRDKENQFDNGEEVTFEGFEITDPEPILDLSSIDEKIKEAEKNKNHEDTRVFVPYSTKGTLFVATAERLLAKTDAPLPEGLCGGPTIDKHGTISGIIEGIVPKDHEDERLAGAAAFIPSFRIQQFIDFAEHLMLKTILPQDVFDGVVELKTTGELGNANMNPDYCASEIERHIQALRKIHSKEEVEAIMKTIRREREEVVDIMTTEGGRLDEVVARVRANTLKKQQAQTEMLLTYEKQKAEKASANGSASTVDGKFDAQSDNADTTSNKDKVQNMADAEYEEKSLKDETTTTRAY